MAMSHQQPAHLHKELRQREYKNKVGIGNKTISFLKRFVKYNITQVSNSRALDTLLRRQLHCKLCGLLLDLDVRAVVC